jgi:hypothetical protein
MGSGLVEQVVAGEAPPLVPLTVEQYHTMLERGILNDGDPVELVEGLLVRKDRSAQGGPPMTHEPPHALAVSRRMKLASAAETLDCHLRVQLPVTLSHVDEPEPDPAIVRGSMEQFGGRHPGPPDVLVVIEVADSSRRYDRGTKLRVYATAGVPTHVIVNVPQDRIEVHTEPVPAEGRYARRTDHSVGETFTLPPREGRALPERMADILGAGKQ